MSIVYKKKVKAGILLYALFMAAVFSLLLQFYLNRQVSHQRIFKLSRERTKAYAMAVLAKADEGKEEAITLNDGLVHCSQKGRLLEVRSQLAGGQTYTFFFEAEKEAQPSESDSDRRDSGPSDSQKKQAEPDEQEAAASQ